MAGPAPTPTGVLKISHDCGGPTFAWCIAYTGGPPSVATMNSIATLAMDSFATNLKALMASDYGMTLTKVRDLANPATPEGEDATEVVGTRAGNLTPASVAALLNFSVNRLYRGSKPKAWLNFGTDADIGSLSNKQWSSEFTNAVDAGWTAYVAALSGTTTGTTTLGDQVAVSYYSGKEANPNPNSRLRFQPTPRAVPLIMAVEVASCSPIFGSQRRRLKGL